MQPSTHSTNPTNSGKSNDPEGALNRASSGAHTAVDSIAGDADHMARKAKPAIDQVATIAHHAVDNAAEAVAPTANWLFDKGENLHSAQKKLVADSRSYVSNNPLKSVGVAVAAGFLFSRFIR